MVLWGILTALFFTGIIELEPVGSIEISAIFALTVIIFILHLLSFLRRYVHEHFYN